MWKFVGEETYLRILTLNTLHLLESFVESSRSLLKTSEYAVPFFLVQRVTRLPLFRWVDHHLNQTLSHDRCAQADRHKLVDLLHDLRIEATELEVSSTVPALSNHTLRDAVQRRKLHVLVLLRIGLLHAPQHTLETVEFPNEHVSLVDLVCHDDQLLLSCKFDHCFDVVF